MISPKFLHRMKKAILINLLFFVTLIISAQDLMSFQDTASNQEETNDLHLLATDELSSDEVAEKRAGITLAWSLLPGGGQFYNKQVGKGLLFSSAIIFSVVIIPMFAYTFQDILGVGAPIIFISGITLYAYSFVDAQMVCKRINSSKGNLISKRYKDFNYTLNFQPLVKSSISGKLIVAPGLRLAFNF